MNKILSFAKLDYITVKPYLTFKNLSVFIAIAAVMAAVTKSASVSIGVVMGFATIYVSYPFVVGEKSGMDILYATLSIKRGTVVLGRYIFTVSLTLFGGLAAYLASYALSAVTRYEFNAQETFATVVVLYAVFSLTQAIQIPLFFKLGYTKAKPLVYLPIVILPFAVSLLADRLSRLIPFERITSYLDWLTANPIYTAIFGIAVWLMIMSFSYGAALAAYRKRDF